MSKRSSSKAIASFVEPMLALSANSLPEGPEWEFELFLRKRWKCAWVMLPMAEIFVASPHSSH